MTRNSYIPAFQKVYKGFPISNKIHKELGNHHSHSHKQKAEQTKSQQLFLETWQNLGHWIGKLLPWKLEKQIKGYRLSQFTKSTSPGAEAHSWGLYLSIGKLLTIIDQLLETQSSLLSLTILNSWERILLEPNQWAFYQNQTSLRKVNTYYITL